MHVKIHFESIPIAAHTHYYQNGTKAREINVFFFVYFVDENK